MLRWCGVGDQENVELMLLLCVRRQGSRVLLAFSAMKKQRWCVDVIENRKKLVLRRVFCSGSEGGKGGGGGSSVVVGGEEAEKMVMMVESKVDGTETAKNRKLANLQQPELNRETAAAAGLKKRMERAGSDFGATENPKEWSGGWKSKSWSHRPGVILGVGAFRGSAGEEQGNLEKQDETNSRTAERKE
ncbi:OLC1v1000639C1 [Oldenlandia corymbosa var. corymbosa]|uniref:OLC1v1000639C1 n=1 Tax=Oldenlandia corymbosa var. corymbosa TaxID=529605 RepID=A0AAV1D6D1_OLDCO|nr:OLC1v1000639C1 [Oldenlandia corymbosa var. corymbosa]